MTAVKVADHPIQLTDLPYIDSSKFQRAADPYPVIREAMETSWIYRSDRGVEILSYEPSRVMLKDRRLSQDHNLLAKDANITHPAVWRFRVEFMINTVGSLHARLRSSVARYFAPPHVEELRHAIRSIIETLLNEQAGHETSRLDLFAAVCDRTPALTYAYMVRAPEADAPFIARMSRDILKIFRRDPALAPTVEAAYLELFDYIEARFEEARTNPGDDLLSNLVRSEADGSLSHQEAADLATLLLEASTDNTANEMALVLSVLMEHPDVWTELVADPSLVPAAVEEAIRIRPRVVNNDRVALEDLTWENLEVPKGTRFNLSVHGANRDPEIYSDPDKFDIHRSDPPRHLMFGGGMTVCLGQNLARVEIEEFIYALLSRYPNLECHNTRDWAYVGNVTEVHSFPVTLRKS